MFRLFAKSKLKIKEKKNVFIILDKLDKNFG